MASSCLKTRVGNNELKTDLRISQPKDVLGVFKRKIHLKGPHHRNPLKKPQIGRNLGWVHSHTMSNTGDKNSTRPLVIMSEI